MSDLINDAAHGAVGAAVVAAGVGVVLVDHPVFSLLLGALAGAIVGAVAELKEVSPQVTVASLSEIGLRDWLGYVIGGATAGLTYGLIF